MEDKINAGELVVKNLTSSDLRELVLCYVTDLLKPMHLLFIMLL